MSRLLNHLASGRTRWTLALLAAIGSGATAASAQDPLKLLLNNYKQIFDNADVTVIRAHYGPHERIPVHDHSSYATVFVYLNDSGAVRIDHAEQGEKLASVTRPPTVKGSYRIAPGIKERHSIENLGDTSSEFLRVELKRVSLQIKEPFRERLRKACRVTWIKLSSPIPLSRSRESFAQGHLRARWSHRNTLRWLLLSPPYPWPLGLFRERQNSNRRGSMATHLARRKDHTERCFRAHPTYSFYFRFKMMPDP